MSREGREGRTGIRAARVVTANATHAAGLGVVENGAVVLEGEHVVYVGAAAAAPAATTWIDAPDAVVTPGLVDAHTHACWVGSRHGEYAVRMAGGDYRAIAEAGGGIAATARAVAQATENDLAAALEARLRRMASLGVTCVEVKSGYGLEPDAEHKQLRAIARVAAKKDLPAIVPTFLALHAVPASSRADRAGYVRRVADELVPRVAAEGLARFVDAYLDANAFSVDEARPVVEAARTAGLGVRLHVGQFADVGGAAFAATHGAASVDHVEHVSPEDARALAAAGVVAILLPVASFTLGQAPPPVALLREAGVALAVASDANPGTAPTESLPLALACAVRLYGLSPEEALLGVTAVAARSLGLATGPEIRGVLREGARADLVVWDLPHELALLQPWGTPRARAVYRDGVRIA